MNNGNIGSIAVRVKFLQRQVKQAALFKIIQTARHGLEHIYAFNVVIQRLSEDEYARLGIKQTSVDFIQALYQRVPDMLDAAGIGR